MLFLPIYFDMVEVGTLCFFFPCVVEVGTMCFFFPLYSMVEVGSAGLFLPILCRRFYCLCSLSVS